MKKAPMKKIHLTLCVAVCAMAGVLAGGARPAQAQLTQAQVFAKAFQVWQFISQNPQFMNAPVGAPGPCRDPWVSSAFRIVFQRDANATGDNGECNYRNFGGGSWNSYQDLLWKVAWYRAYKELGLVRGGAQPDPSLASPQGLQPYLNAAIADVTGKAPEGEVNPAQYGLGYDEIKARVQAVYYPCDDDNISKAILQTLDRAPRGVNNQGECTPQLYGNGKWEDYADLQSKVRKTLVTQPYKVGQCRDRELTRAISEVRKQMGAADATPSGMGELGECNEYLYGYGQWSSYADLKSKVATALTNLKNANIQLEPDNSIKAQHMERGGGGGVLMALMAAANAYMQWKAAQPAKQQNMQMQQMPMQQPGAMQMQQQPMQGQMQMQMPGMNMIQPGAQMPMMQQPMMQQQPMMMQPQMQQQPMQQQPQMQQQPMQQPMMVPGMG